jgi:hypothetical protein
MIGKITWTERDEEVGSGRERKNERGGCNISMRREREWSRR